MLFSVWKNDTSLASDSYSNYKITHEKDYNRWIIMIFSLSTVNAKL